MLLDRAVNRPRAGVEYRELDWGDMQTWIRQVFFSGEEMTASKTNAERLSPVAAAHRILTCSFGMIPFGIYRKEDGARLPVDDPTLNQLLKVRPNPDMTPFLVKKTQMSNAFWHGVGYIWNRRDDRGQLIERIPLPSECCSIRKDLNTGILWYDFNVDGVQKTFLGYELSMLFFESYDGVRGRGMLDLARESIAADAMAQRYAKKFYQNGARVSGIVELDADADKDTRDKVKSAFRRYASDEAFAVAVLDHGMKYTPLGINQHDAQFIESREFAVEEIARFSGVPKFMLQVGKEAYNSNAQQRINFVTDTLVPYVTQAEQEDSWKLPTPGQKAQGWYVKGNVDVLLRADPQTRMEYMVKGIEHSIFNPDECRAKDELNPIPGGLGKQFMATKNLGSLESVLKGDGENA
ncbi:phage portal protein [Vermiculatibacterium agrestimuris]|uniref:phage portal protein n=1 Tax=Vermiculatibacterium agrestimuris TaxID=2941519 RepID=UPI00203ADEB4|nr:phage portal protein [Vermiculatibacterium agrestimuris]